MFDKSEIFFLLAETSLHAGSGDDVGYVDLPIQRNKVTNLPIIQPSELKGAIREFFEAQNEKATEIGEVFGPEDGSEFASAISFSEARVLFFPVKSIYGVFAYITCPLVLNQFLKDAGINLRAPINEIDDGNILIRNDDSIIKVGNQVVLNDYPFAVLGNMQIPQIESNGQTADSLEFLKEKIFPLTNEYSYWKDNFPKRVAIVSDNTFTTFTEISTEIITRNKIGEGGVVSGPGGGLWNEENLPQETILYSVVSASKPYKKDNHTFENSGQIIGFVKDGMNKNGTAILNGINGRRVQMGGHKTVGKGFILVKFFE